ncbi:MAG: MFS transporter [Gammaproteobacteria bacterium]|nr:MFS transporter [Gammaproteobacteria bacterium]
MLSTVLSIYSLLLAVSILLLGSGLLGTLIGLRARIEGFSNPVIGIVMSAFFVGYVLGAYLCPRLIRDVGYIRAFSVLAAIAAVAMIVHGLVIDPFVWWCLRIISGVCVVGLYMIVESWLHSLIKHNPKRGRLFSIYIMTTLIALGMGQYLLLAYGPEQLASFALGAVFFILSLIPIAVTKLTQPLTVAIPQLMLKKLYRHSPLGTVGAFCSGMLSGAFWGMGAVYAAGIGFDTTHIALFISSVILGGVLLQYPIGHQSDVYDRRLVLLLTTIAAAIIAWLIYLLHPSSELAMLGMVLLYGGCSFSIYSLCVAHAQDQVEIDMVLDATRTLLLLSGIGAAIGPILAGILMQWLAADALMLFFALVLSLLGIYAGYRLSVGKPVPAEAQEAFMPITRTSPEVVELDPRTETGIEEVAESK